jgi:hypothetical protein
MPTHLEIPERRNSSGCTSGAPQHNERPCTYTPDQWVHRSIPTPKSSCISSLQCQSFFALSSYRDRPQRRGRDIASPTAHEGRTGAISAAPAAITVVAHNAPTRAAILNKRMMAVAMWFAIARNSRRRLGLIMTKLLVRRIESCQIHDDPLVGEKKEFNVHLPPCWEC